MHIVYPNYDYDKGLHHAEAVLGRHRHLIDWAESVARTGAQVSVVHRFDRDTELTQNGVRHVFVDDPPLDYRALDERSKWVEDAVADLHPDVVHLFQLGRARPAAQLKREVRGAAVLLQEYNDTVPVRWMQRWRLRRALSRMDGIAFAAQGQADAWQEAGVLPRSSHVFELPDGSSRFGVQQRGPSRKETRLDGDPVCLWVGRLSYKNDPMTVLRGFNQALNSLPKALLVMVYEESELFRSVQAWLAAYPEVSQHVVLHGKVPPERMEPIFNSADLFVIGTSAAGSALAVVDGLACGVAPVVTDIPAFRALTGQGAVGKLWQTGSPEACAAAIVDAARIRNPESPQKLRAFFETNLGPSALAAQALKVYGRLSR